MTVSVPGIQGKVAIDGIEQAINGLKQLAGAFDQVGGIAPKARKPVDDIVGALVKFSVIKEAVGSLVSLGQATIQSYSDNERLASSLQSLVAKEQLASGAATNMTQTLGQATGKSQELLQWTQQLAIQSPFSQEGVAQAFKMAQAYGFVSETAIKADVDAKRLTQAMIDFASGSGQSEETMSRIALALGQVQAKGKLAGGEMLQLTEAGLNVRQILADAFGKSTSEIVQMQEKGLIPANKAITAIVESLERDFGGAAKRQANTWQACSTRCPTSKKWGCASSSAARSRPFSRWSSSLSIRCPTQRCSRTFGRGATSLGKRSGWVPRRCNSLPGISKSWRPSLRVRQRPGWSTKWSKTRRPSPRPPTRLLLGSHRPLRPSA